MTLALENYHQLVTRVDTLCKGITDALGEQITCSAGCSSCCLSITVFPVEAEAMREALEKMPPFQVDEIRRHVAKHADGEQCPLLLHDHCLLYSARPIICRTHGLPIVYTVDDQRNSDCCPHNMIAAETVLSGSNVVNLDTLNTVLSAVNTIFLSQPGNGISAERLTIAEVIAAIPAVA